MSDESRKPIREHLNEKLAALGALHSMAHLNAHPSANLPGATVFADYKTVLGQLDLEALQAIGAAAAELRKPTVRDLVDRLWSAGPLTFKQVQTAVVEADAPAGQIETLLNRLRNAGLLEASAGPGESTEVPSPNAVTQPPTRIPIEEPGEITLNLAGTPEEAVSPAVDPMDGDVTSNYSRLVTAPGREWFDERARAKGIDLGERINCQF